MKRISLKGISEILSERELKNVMGGSTSLGNGCGGIITCGGSCVTPSGIGTCNMYFSGFDISHWHCACYVS
jgi:hypothetical protein